MIPRRATATAVSCPNIALVKYWGSQDTELNIPANGSISITMGGLETTTTVTFDPKLATDRFILNGAPRSDSSLTRVSGHLDRVRRLSGLTTHAEVISGNNFPLGAGIASSASAFASLTLAATWAAGLELSPRDHSRMARLGSGSACRSVFGGYVEWFAGDSHETSFAETILPPEHWPLVDVVVVVSREPKRVSSSAGHGLARTSPIQASRVADAPRRLDGCRQALLERDFDRLAAIVELDSNLMHAVMLTSDPPLLYWSPSTIMLMQEVVAWRKAGLGVCYTVDAGPNVHCLCEGSNAPEIARRLRAMDGVLELYECRPGPPARLMETSAH